MRQLKLILKEWNWILVLIFVIFDFNPKNILRSQQRIRRIAEMNWEWESEQDVLQLSAVDFYLTLFSDEDRIIDPTNQSERSFGILHFNISNSILINIVLQFLHSNILTIESQSAFSAWWISQKFCNRHQTEIFLCTMITKLSFF